MESYLTVSKKFTRCNNSKCGAVFSYDPLIVSGEERFLCPSCRTKVETHHVVQCKKCQAIVSFIYAEPGEEPVVFYLEKCSHCTGTIKDEREMTPFYYPDAFI